MSIHRYATTVLRPAAWLALALSVLWPVGALAQEPAPTLESLTIELWPEFDQPGVLVIYNGVLTAPADEVSLLLPADATLNATAYRDSATGNLLTATYDAQPEADGLRVVMALQADNFWVEFYTPADVISQAGDIRSFTYTWRGDLAVEQLTWRVQQPATASDLTVEPSGGQVGVDSFDLPQYEVQASAVAAGETASASVTYQKADDVLSAELLETAQPAIEPPAQPARADSMGTILPIALAVLGVGLLAGGVFFYWRSGRQATSAAAEETTPRPAGRQTTRAQRAAQQRQAATTGYCTNCGNALQPSDKFCRECGTPVRS